MADPIDTGPGGFAINGNQEFFDVGLSEPSNGLQPYGVRESGVDVSAGYIDEHGKKKDLTKVTKVTLSQYLSNLTKGKDGSTSVPNSYTIDPAFHDVSTTTPFGDPGLQSPGASSTSNSEAFAPSQNDISALSNNFTNIQAPVVALPLKKGKASYNGTDGHNLLPGLPGTVKFTANDGDVVGDKSSSKPATGHTDTTSIISPYVSSVLKQNRFAQSAQKQMFGATASSAAGFNPAFSKQTKLGEFNPNAPTVTPDQLATIGPLLTLRAGKELASNNSGANPNGFGLEAAALLPGMAQIGISRVDVSTLSAEDILSKLTTDVLDASNVLNINDLSWGQLNNTDDPFSGTNALGMLGLSIALVAGVELLIDGLSMLLNQIKPTSPQPGKDIQGRYTLGQYFANEKSGNKAAAGGIGGAVSALSSLNFGALLGILPTNFPFSQALSTGANAFFGIQGGGGVGGQLMGAVTSSADSPGFNVVVARAIIRSGITVTQSLSKIGGNPMSVITSILSMIDTIRSSKLISACNVFAMLGDAILTTPDAYKDKSDPLKVSAVDSYTDNIHASEVVKNRLNGTLKLAWASNRAPAQLLLPPSIMIANNILPDGLGQFDSYAGIPKERTSNVSSQLMNGRIDTITATDFEKTLESSYVPFYFHDIRTNEMIAFHAFLASITDDYAAAYEKSEGFGRVEPVRIYKNTERRISLSFYVAATSENDFDDMWTKINKLTTLVYPQYTQGTTVSDKDRDNVFTQPFSQMIGASPLIRIRLGDLLRSNYTPFALGRLFGLGNSNFKIGKQSINKLGALSIDDMASFVADMQGTISDPVGKSYWPSYGAWPRYVKPEGNVIGVSLPSIGGGTDSSAQANANQFLPDNNYFEVEITQLYPGSTDLVVGKVKLRTDDAFRSWPRYAETQAKYSNEKDVPHKFIDGLYVFPMSALTVTNKQKDIIKNANSTLQQIVTGNSDFATQLNDFLSADKNAIAKSFQDTGGKGLAGFIETMSFDWHDKVTWDTRLGSTAPKLCKVTMGFSPIHDISPGIDHMGHNRAPVYPVGIMGHKDLPTPKRK